MGHARFDGNGSSIKLNLVVSSIDLTSYTNVIEVKQLTAIGESLNDIKVWCYDLPFESDVIGVLGYNFLEHFDINISFSSNTIDIKRIKKKEKIWLP